MYAAMIAKNAGRQELDTLSNGLWTNDNMQGYTENLKASKDGGLRYNERSGLIVPEFEEPLTMFETRKIHQIAAHGLQATLEQLPHIR